jgi:hypothetical protein
MIPAIRFQKFTIGMLTPPKFVKITILFRGGFTIRQPTLDWIAKYR